MSREMVKTIISRTKENEEFMQAVLEDTDTALKNYDLSEKERDFFRNADRKTLEGLSASCFELAEN